MSHVDRETLHAYLDGELGRGALDQQAIDEHIAQCGECAAALDDVRRVKDRAAQILSASGPLDVSAPPFDQLRALRNEPNTSGPVPSLGRMKAIAWAATVVLAVGAGWYARAASITGDPAPAERPRAEIPVGAIDEPAQSATPVGDLDTLVPTLAQARLAEDAPKRDRPMSDSTASASAARNVATPADPDRPLEQFAAALEQPRGDPPAPAELREGFEARKVAVDESVLRVSPAPRSAAGVGAERTVWTAASEEDAESLLARSVPVIEGVEVIDYATSTVGSRGRVRVRQRLDRQLIVELIVQQVDSPDRLARGRAEFVAADQLPIAADQDTLNSARALRNGLQITLNGALPVDSLRALMQRVHLKKR